MSEQAKIVLIDGNALVHRAFHGIPPLMTHDGVMVNAVYGFTSTIFHILENLHPKYIVCTFDVSRETFRSKLYPDYKATRVKAPDELYAQFPLVKEVCKVLNIPQFGVKGYEADDVIGSIAAKIQNSNNKLQINSKAQNYKLKTLIATGDQDTLQLINESTAVYNLGRGIKRAEIIDEKRFQDKYGFPAKYMVDYKALRGDPSDNIPGVTGIGEVMAKKLVCEFGTIENLYDKILNSKSKPQFPNPKTLNLLLKYKDQAFLSKKLATIVQDVPLDFKLADAKVHDYNKKLAEKLFTKLDFKSLLKRLPHVESNHQQSKLF